MALGSIIFLFLWFSVVSASSYFSGLYVAHIEFLWPLFSQYRHSCPIVWPLGSIGPSTNGLEMFDSVIFMRYYSYSVFTAVTKPLFTSFLALLSTGNSSWRLRSSFCRELYRTQMRRKMYSGVLQEIEKNWKLSNAAADNCFDKQKLFFQEFIFFSVWAIFTTCSI